MTGKEKELLAQTLYMSGKFTQKAIAEMTDIAERTVRRWIEQGKWEQVRQIQTVTKAELLKESYAQLARINKKVNDEMGGIPDKQLSDAKAQCLREIEAFDERSLQVYADCFEDFSSWLMRTQPKHAPMFSQLLMRFLDFKMQ
jgi:predicted transglutaminase-like cysteine proteinase